LRPAESDIDLVRLLFDKEELDDAQITQSSVCKGIYTEGTRRCIVPLGVEIMPENPDEISKRKRSLAVI
jgi:hypothetical protein